MLFVTSLGYSQVVSAGFDISNAIQGSDVNVPSLDFQIKIASITGNREIGLQIEHFEEIKYSSFGMFVNKVIPLDKFQLVAGLEGLMIFRKDFVIVSYGFNGEIRYYFTDKIGISYQYNIRRRRDLQVMYLDGRFVNSGFINLIYKWK